MRGVGGLAAFRRALCKPDVLSPTFSSCRLLRSSHFSVAAPAELRHPSFLHANGSIHSQTAGTTVHLSTAAVAEEIHARGSRLSNIFEKSVVLYQYEACPFCNKVRAFLDYHSIPYMIVEVNPMRKKEIKWSAYKKVPILVVGGEQLVHSSGIIDTLFNMIHPDKASQLGSDEEEKKWRGWVDNHLVHLLAPNIYRTASEAIESFDYITTYGKFNMIDRIAARYMGAAAMYFVSKKLKKKHNIIDERQALYQAADEWVDALGTRNFLGGSAPNLADLAVFGVLRPVRSLRSGEDMVEHTAIGDWYTRMEHVVGNSCTSRS